ncbi:MAG: hypothetical protein J6J18_09265 [Oscillospiraceae bacterium]|nr:hypothetical protein [Oscillospiraceae bacterium]
MERISRVRAVALLVIFALIVCFYSMKLFSLQIIETDGNTDNTTTFTTLTRVKAARGDILDRNGNILVGNRASYDLVFNHYVITSSDNTNESLYKLVKKCQEMGVSYNDHFPITASRPFEYTLDQYSTAWRGYFQSYLSDRSIDSDITAPLLMENLRDRYDIPETWTDEEARAVIGLRYEFDLRGVVPNLSNYVFIEDVSDENLSAIKELNIPGLMVESSTVREYHTKYAAHILGTMGAMDADDWAEYKEKGYAMDAVIGQSGFEAAFEDYLHGTDGTRVDVVDKNGTIISQYYANEYDDDGNVVGTKNPKAGNNVETTLDLNIQIAAEDALSDVILWLQNPETNTEEAGRDVEGAAVVVMKVKTGEILACASYPTYNPITYNEDYDLILEQDYDPLFNRAFHAAYPPGSSYKPCTLIAAMTTGKYTAGEIITDEGVFRTYEDQGFAPKCLVYTNYRITHGPIDAQTALEVSCNYFFYELGDRISSDALDSTAKALGLGEPTGIELDETLGYRSNAETKKLLYGDGLNSGYYTGNRILAAIGQDENRFTPMQLAVYTSTLANQGTRMKATFLSRVVSADYTSLVYDNQPQIVSQLEISDEIYKTYVEGMKAVISGSLGTARETMRGMDVAVAAKTGTAQTGMLGSDNGAFICFAPADDPEIAIVVYGEKAAHGSTLGQVAKAIIEVYFDGDDEIGEVAYVENSMG